MKSICPFVNGVCDQCGRLDDGIIMTCSKYKTKNKKLTPPKKTHADCEYWLGGTKESFTIYDCGCPSSAANGITSTVCECEKFGKCTPWSRGGRFSDPSIRKCIDCEFNPSNNNDVKVSSSAMNWSYGITTVPERVDTLLKGTLDSLAKAGFDKPILFVDGLSEGYVPPLTVGGVVIFHPKVGHIPNWQLALLHLYSTQPTADRYAIFEDDLLATKGLRQYLDHCSYPERGYWNLLTHPENLILTSGNEGWHLSNQRGRGAVGLVFNREIARAILSSHIFLDRSACGSVAADGMVMDSVHILGYKEHIHFPTLLQHVGGNQSTMGHKYGEMPAWRGEDFDLTTITITEPHKPVPRPTYTPMQTLERPRHGWLPRIRFIQIQTNSLCNADCVFCPYVESEHAKAANRMTDETWKLIIDNLVPFKDTINQGKVCPYLMQEPLIDKTIFSKIADIYKYFPTTCCEVSTNGAALTAKVTDKLLESMSNSRHDIWVSHHGINKETLEHIMKIDYGKAMANLVNLIQQSNGRFNIRIRGAGESYNQKQSYFTREQYLQHWQEIANTHSLNMDNVQIDYFRYHDRAGTLHRADRGANELNAGIVREIDPAHPFHCPRLDEWLHFMWDGTIRLCCMDYHGEVKLPNVHDMSILDYFHGAEYYELTEQVSGRTGCKPGHICTRCISPGG